MFEEVPQRLVFVGHVHVPFVYGERCGEAVSARLEPFEYGVPLALDPEDRYVISVGAVGYPRDGIKAIRYGIYDSGAQTIELRRVEGPVLPLGSAAFADRNT